MSAFKNFSRIATITGIVLCLFSSVFGYSGGSGTTSNPYKIANAADLLALAADANDYNDCFVLVNDLNLAGYTFTKAVIAPDIDSSTDGFQGTAFTGVFDGNGHSIISLKIDTGGADNSYLGLFGRIGSGGIIKNLGIEDVNITGGASSYFVGGLCGMNFSGSITNCYSTGDVNGIGHQVGGLCGVNGYANITNCYSTGNVSGKWDVGGLCGYSYGNITNCYSTGTVIGTGNYVGGLVGENDSGSITNCYSTGTVSGSYFVGGLCGENCEGSISNCYSTGNVTGNVSGTGSYVGGLVGRNDYGSISNCYSTGTVSGNNYVGGFCGYKSSGSITGCYFLITAGSSNGYGTPLTDAQMKQQASFVGWDFVGETTNGTSDIWRMYFDGNGYPRMAWNTRYSGGSGTTENPYLIAIAADMNTIGADSNDWNKCFLLVNDIDMSVYDNNEYNVICGDHTRSWFTMFQGVFDGDGHTIRNLRLNINASMIGLFGYIGSNGIIKNIRLESLDIKAMHHVGGIAGRNEGIIQNCHVSGIVEGQQACGGITGYCSRSSSKILNCSFDGRVTGTSGTGGIVGSTDMPEITNCYAIIEIIGGDGCGGIAGHNMGGNLSSCFAKGSITCSGYVGGLVGNTSDHCGYGGIISNCYADVIVNCNKTAGGFSGSQPGRDGKILNCYCSGKVVYDVNNHSNIGGFLGTYLTSHPSGVFNSYFLDTAGPNNGWGEPLTDAQMKQQESFVGWDFSYSDGNDAVWFMAFDGYPILTWQISPADIYTDGENNFKDWTLFANYWMREDCRMYNDFCEFSDMDFDHDVDIDDLMEFISYWLEEGIY